MYMLTLRQWERFVVPRGPSKPGPKPRPWNPTDTEIAAIAAAIAENRSAHEIMGLLGTPNYGARARERLRALGLLDAYYATRRVDRRMAGVVASQPNVLHVGARNGETLEQIGRQVGITRERVRQIYAKFPECGELRWKAKARQRLARYAERVPQGHYHVLAQLAAHTGKPSRVVLGWNIRRYWNGAMRVRIGVANHTGSTGYFRMNRSALADLTISVTGDGQVHVWSQDHPVSLNIRALDRPRAPGYEFRLRVVPLYGWRLDDPADMTLVQTELVRRQQQS